MPFPLPVKLNPPTSPIVTFRTTRVLSGVMLTVAEALLFPMFVSAGLDTPAVFVTVMELVVAFVAVATTVTVTLLPTATLVKVQDNGLALLHDPLLVVVEARVSSL